MQKKVCANIAYNCKKRPQTLGCYMLLGCYLHLQSPAFIPHLRALKDIILHTLWDPVSLFGHSGAFKMREAELATAMRRQKSRTKSRTLSGWAWTGRLLRYRSLQAHVIFIGFYPLLYHPSSQNNTQTGLN